MNEEVNIINNYSELSFIPRERSRCAVGTKMQNGTFCM